MKIGRVVQEMCSLTDKLALTERQTDTVITILRSAIEGGVIITK